MCTRYASDLTMDDWAKLYDRAMQGPPLWNFEPSYNVVITQTIPVVMLIEGRRVLERMRWGVIPGFHKGTVKEWKAATYNTRSETVETSGLWKRIWTRNRCLIPVSGFYEWYHTTGTKKGTPPQPYYFTDARGAPALTIAGIFDRWNDPETAFTSSGLDWSDRFAPICEAAKLIPANHAVLDGEIVVQNSKGIPDLGGLRSAIGRQPHRLLFYAFDLLHFDGFDLRGATLGDRRRVLAQLIETQPGGRIVLSETIGEPGDVLLRHACEMGLEGIVAKRADASYRSGRVETWLKVKCIRRLALPVIGFVPAKGGSIAALRLGRRDGKQMVYVGKVGTGFSVRTAQTARQRFEPLMRKTPPVAKPLKRPDTIWVEPTVEADIAYIDMTEDGMLRHASFKGLK